MKNSALNSPRILELKKKKYETLRKKIYFFIFLFFLILVGLSFLSRWDNLNIDNIEVSGNKVIETKVIEDIVKDKIAGNYFYFFPKTNFFFYPKNKIITELTDKFRRIKNISINLRNLKTLEISLTERVALYTYCGDTLDLKPEIENQECYFIDESGYIFDEALYFSGNVYLKFFGILDKNKDSPLGSYFYQPYFKKLVALKETLNKINIKPVAFFIEDNEDVKMFLSSSVTYQMGPEIIFKLDSDFDKVIENLQSVLTTEPLKSDFKNKYDSLLYIDLRFGNKVYYKFK
ncbi:MAG: hypothetical protein UR25_C0001G0153 [Candidatus Nomurabacteria bacterium GW2011_GWE1_32_28]|uniref:Uncharacterized protein n=1 Tax=Candidatus Nomurabacteria bacterium GW2011_GWF1_31_48 TaxID=1618767 RepID=A0A0G0BI57_9BACT|nr:MAG: hypothetical protein UR10_C0001G0106 [Candidatus Nomurabacteria bacterium GW2011_GWF2_30_133]KKP28984.1 MAG: hypothetical protein UR18_C0001G0105 [Candidatus Nomurabacteria bacterium GW2011_GWE2_31_40]KKP30722.1 MAG: hypothetical protein UR19_C0001G0106 [Candidatus Nomurabacteria bacterium GW2011_GWF1_31_48]KKP35240.1 MAG: hypothetical protein UR25_C0001G0153 [Candidatus Nomurabacteria bacterium GW2011_GWE1_32_28]HAS80547.1 hypothetical protein [Candidatus Nomurabacteria bacterium]